LRGGTGGLGFRLNVLKWTPNGTTPGFTLAGTVKAEPPPAPAARTTGLRILVAEDHPVNQEVAKLILQRLGHRVVAVADGRAALAALAPSRREAFDLVLMDVQMPDGDGFETTLLIRAREAGRHARLPIIALTAHALASDREKAFEVGCDGYLAKPCEPRAVVAEVQRFLGRNNGH